MYDHEKMPVWLRRQLQRRLDSGGDVRTIRQVAKAASLKSRRTQGATSTEPTASTVASNVVLFPVQGTLPEAPAGREAC